MYFIAYISSREEKKGSQWAVNLHWSSSWHCLLALGKVKVTCGTCLSWVWPAWDVSDAQLSDTSHSKQPESKHGLKGIKLPTHLFRDKFHCFTSHYPHGCMKSSEKDLKSFADSYKKQRVCTEKSKNIYLTVLLFDKAICKVCWQCLTIFNLQCSCRPNSCQVRALPPSNCLVVSK